MLTYSNKWLLSFIPKQFEKLVFGSVGLAANFWSSLAPCSRAVSLGSPDTKIYAVSLLNLQLFKLFGCILFYWSVQAFAAEDLLEQLAQENQIVLATKRMFLEDYPDAFNPSLISFNGRLLLTFRYTPDRWNRPWMSYIGVVFLNEALEPISEPELLSTRFIDSKTPSQSEDAKIFSYRDRLFLIYNDNIDISPATHLDRRDMFIVELFYDKGHFALSAPLKLYHERKQHQHVQKNWIPFEWNKKLLLAYTINPHEILYPNLYSGACYPCHETSFSSNWQFGTLKGSTPPLLVDGEYLAFFHSWIRCASEASWGLDLYHYFMGAYTFSAEPPFAITQISPMPIIAPGFYTRSYYEKLVIFPGGFIVSGSTIYLAYGKDDSEIWIATLDKAALKKSLQRVSK